ncbi:MAG: endonuclease/exonuclease/phosphatase family protein [Paludibacter sp.]|jgi:endonuclease/exonuclease/phosphatase family metal-dependent hydrolase|nr:endonuclease/exonuclease/phosphatase family protein [Paludibacter sp.]
MFGKKLFTGIMLAINVLIALPLLLSLLAAVVSPEKFVYLAYFSLFFPVIAVVNIIFMLFWIIFRRWLFLVSLAALIIAHKPLSENFAINFDKIATENVTHSFSILTYNTHVMYWMVKEKGNPIISHVLNANADVVCLQEFSVSDNKKLLSEEDVLNLLSIYPYHHIEYRGRQSGNMSAGIATFSKFPIVNREKIEYDTKGNLSIFSDIAVSENDTIRLINNHLESNIINDAEWQKLTDLQHNFDTDKLKSSVLYFSGKLNPAYNLRARQAAEVAKVVNASPYETVVCGDFNDVPGSYVYEKMKGKLKDAFTENGFGLGWTYNSSVFKVRIDYVLYSSNLLSSEYIVKKVKYSDHYPVYCKISY